jgi:hypothetical protein
MQFFLRSLNSVRAGEPPKMTRCRGRRDKKEMSCKLRRVGRRTHEVRSFLIELLFAPSQALYARTAHVGTGHDDARRRAAGLEPRLVERQKRKTQEKNGIRKMKDSVERDPVRGGNDARRALYRDHIAA